MAKSCKLEQLVRTSQCEQRLATRPGDVYYQGTKPFSLKHRQAITKSQSPSWISKGFGPHYCLADGDSNTMNEQAAPFVCFRSQKLFSQVFFEVSPVYRML